MKNWIVVKGTLWLAVAAVFSCMGAMENLSADPADVSSEGAGADLENAPARLVSTPAQVAPAANLSPAANEVARLAQSGVDQSVMLAFVNNSPNAFDLASEQIIYLNDIGVPGEVVTSMIQHDQLLKSNGVAQPAAPLQNVAPPPPAVMPEAPAATDANVSATYFQDSLAPYGNWIDVEGYGQCWQPSVVVVDRSWTPYCDRGHWVYSDCGWYWSSDYSWGWAPFHYGRWFRNSHWGWCWAPDTVWGPSWVSWRYNSGFCGWAPLPPTACFRPGFGFTYFGRSVDAGFGFGLGSDRFTFVATDNFRQTRLDQHRIPRQQVVQIFNHTTIINPVEERGNPRFRRGIPVKGIAAVTHVDIKPVTIRETATPPMRGRGDERSLGVMTVFRPSLPEPSGQSRGFRVGEAVKPATPATVIPRFDSSAAMHRSIPPGRVIAPERRGDPVPVFKAPPAGNNEVRNPREIQKPAPEIKREVPGETPNLRAPTSGAGQPMTAPRQTVWPKQQLYGPGHETSPSIPLQNENARQVQPQLQRSQPRQEKIVSPQIRFTPQTPAYEPPPAIPVEPRATMRSAPPITAPAVQEPHQTPVTPAPRAPAQKTTGDNNPRDKR